MEFCGNLQTGYINKMKKYYRILWNSVASCKLATLPKQRNNVLV